MCKYKNSCGRNIMRERRNKQQQRRQQQQQQHQLLTTTHIFPMHKKIKQPTFDDAAKETSE